MLSKQMQQGLVEQINKEFHSAYIYLGMEAYFENENYKGMSAWMNSK
jgi:ferritin